ncbi:MAG: Na/Pi cotransporter family protein, partial [Candidatus Omnitrophica bacterium]|nr:Na/Pi cotransporter family protein [Candidatus Omnitrophota bacterium]
MLREKLKIPLKLILVLGFVYLFLVSIGLMGEAFKGFGKDFAESLISTTANPFIGLFIGILATSIVQSSST